MHPSVREPAVMSLSAPGVGRSRHVGSDMMMMDSLHGMLTHAGGAARLGGGARSRVVGGGSTVRPGTAGFDEYQALQMLDEDVVKRGVSDRRMRSFREAPGATSLVQLLAACAATACVLRALPHVPSLRQVRPRLEG